MVRKYSPEGRAKTRRVQAKRKQWNSLINLFIIVNLIVVLLLVFMSARKRQAASPGSSSLPQQQNAAPSYTAPAPPAAPNPGRATTAAPAPVPAPPATMQPSAVDRKLQPPDLDFRSLKAALDEHISRQPADMRSLEKQRIEYISGFREYLSTLITYTPYRTGEDKPLMMPDGRILNGSLGPATKRGINFRPAEAGAAQTEIGWNEIGLDQYMQIFRHYINMREKEKASTTFSTFEVDRQVASDFFRLAIICDWYGRKTEAAEFVRLALRNDTKVAPLVRTMLPAYTQGQTAN